MEMNKKIGRNKSNFIEFLQWIEAVVIAIIIALLIRTFIFEPVMVQQMSMQNTLFEGQRLLVYKLGYYFSTPQKGDIIVFKYQDGPIAGSPFFKKVPLLGKLIPHRNELDYIKRVIAVPGDSVDIKDGYVYVNGKKLNEPYVKGITQKRSVEFPIQKVPEHKLFVLGDNRENSSDSRVFGLIDMDSVKGKAVFRIWPLNVFGGIYKK